MDHVFSCKYESSVLSKLYPSKNVVRSSENDPYLVYIDNELISTEHVTNLQAILSLRSVVCLSMACTVKDLIHISISKRQECGVHKPKT